MASAGGPSFNVMPAQVFLVLCGLVCALLETTSLGQADSYYITLDVKTTIWRRVNITGNTDDMFHNCMCGASSSLSCNTSVSVTFISNTDETIITQADTKDDTTPQVVYFVCSFEPWRINYGNVSCNRKTGKTKLCNTDFCSVNIVLDCLEDEHVTILWDATQEVRLVDSNTVKLVNCCQDIQSTTTELASAITTSSSTKLFTTQPTTNLIATTSFDDTSEGTTSQLVEDTSLNTTCENNRFGSANMVHPQTNDTSFHFSSAHIGIIVGTVVGAILLTVLAMLVIWKFKSSRRNQTEDVNLHKRSQQDLEDTGNVITDDLGGRTQDNSDRALKYVARAPPLAPSPGSGSQYTIDNYTYIDPVVLRTINDKNTDPDIGFHLEVLESHLCTGVTESSVGNSQSEYTKLGEEKVILENPYNYLPPVNQDSTTSQYSRLGETNIPLEKSLYNYLPPNNDAVTSQSSELGKTTIENSSNNSTSDKPDPIATHPDSPGSTKVSIQSMDTQPEPQSCFSGTVNQQSLPSFPVITKSNTMEIGDATCGMYTEIKRLPKKSDTKLDNEETERMTDTNELSSGVQSYQEVKPNTGSSEFDRSEKVLDELYGNVEPTTQSHSNDTYTTQEELPESNIRESVNMIYVNTKK